MATRLKSLDALCITSLGSDCLLSFMLWLKAPQRADFRVEEALGSRRVTPLLASGVLGLEPTSANDFRATTGASTSSCRLPATIVLMYFVRSPCSFDSFHSTSRVVPVIFKLPRFLNFVLRNLSIVSWSISPRSDLPPGSWHDGTIRPPSYLATCTKRFCSTSSILRVTTATTRSASPELFTSKVDFPEDTSSLSASKLLNFVVPIPAFTFNCLSASRAITC
mmetsp:Transcript_46578/g.108593  ORF Transcript_46578/g.108593 Transcript_46578/m.108593 type:complete len:222 (-) Transcript_46578:1119-1784(-)